MSQARYRAIGFTDAPILDLEERHRVLASGNLRLLKTWAEEPDGSFVLAFASISSGVWGQVFDLGVSLLGEIRETEPVNGSASSAVCENGSPASCFENALASSWLRSLS